jgi:hypothetical protein
MGDCSRIVSLFINILRNSYRKPNRKSGSK